MEQKPTAPPGGYSYSTRRDLLIASISTLAVLILARIFDLAEMWEEWAETRESWEVDEFPIAFAILSFGLAWFAVRRWQEFREQVIKTEQANRELIPNLDDKHPFHGGVFALRVGALRPGIPGGDA